MMNSLQRFKEYIASVKQLDVKDKRQEIIRAVNEITAMFDFLASQENIQLTYLTSAEVLDLNNGYESEDDFLEALLVYVENAKSVLGEYLLKTKNINE